MTNESLVMILGYMAWFCCFARLSTVIVLLMASLLNPVFRDPPWPTQPSHPFVLKRC